MTTVLPDTRRGHTPDETRDLLQVRVAVETGDLQSSSSGEGSTLLVFTEVCNRALGTVRFRWGRL